MRARSSAPRAAPRLPTYGNSFVGREGDLAALDRLGDQGARLITVTGPAGIGKTRLAVEHAARIRAATGALVYFVDLAEARTVEELCSAVADALGLLDGAPAEHGSALAARIAAALRERGALLLLLDEFDHLARAAASAVAEWSSSAAELTLLITSPGVLRLSAEVAYELAPLGVLDEGRDAAPPAVELLIDRVGRRRGAAQYIDPAIVTDIVRQLDGIPLAIELAAAQVSALGAVAVRDRLRQQLDLLSRRARDAASRQQTLRAAVEWSWDLLEAEERWTLAACSVFRGGFDLETAENLVRQVLPDELRDARVGVLQCVHRLRDKSLLRFVERANDARPRFESYPSIRALAEEQLSALEAAAGSAGKTALTHAGLYVDAAERRVVEMYGPGELLSLTWLASERDNLLAVVDRRLGEPRRERAELALRALLALDHLVAVRGPLRPQLAAFEALLDADAQVHLSPRRRGAALVALGELRRRCGQLAQARADLEAAIELARASDDARLSARATRTLGVVLSTLGDLALARRTLEHALRLARASGDAATEARTLSSLGTVLGELDRVDRAGECLVAAADLHRAAGDARAEAQTLEELAINLLDRGEMDAARARLERALELQHAEDPAPARRSTAALALLHHLEGSLSEAIVHYGDAIRFARTSGSRALEGIHRGHLGMALSEHGAAREAAGHLDAAISLLGAAGERRHLGLFRACRAEAATRLGDPAMAREMLRGARELVGERQDPLALATQLHSVATEVADAGAPDAASGAQRLIERAEHGPLARRSSVRLGLRSAKRALEGSADEPGPCDASPTQDPAALLVHEGGRWFRLPYGPLVRCGERQVLRRVLVQLANQRLRAPGEPLPFEALLEAGWPGERMRVDAGKNRIRVTLARLRDLGLGPLIQFADGGYLLDPAVTVILSSAKS